MLAGATRGVGGREAVGMGRSAARSSRCLYQEIVWIEEQVGMPFQMGGKHGWDGVREFVYDVDGPAILRKELEGFGVDRYQWVGVHVYTNVLVPIHSFRERLTHFYVKIITHSYIGVRIPDCNLVYHLVHQVATWYTRTNYSKQG